MATTIHLLRHGEVHNPDRILYGRLPGFGLSDRGRDMAERAAAILSGGEGDIRAIVSSPLLRTRQTAEPLARLTGLEVRVDDRVIEAGNDFEGQRVTKESVLEPQNLLTVWNPFRPSWGEAYTAQVLRMKAAIESLRRRIGDGEAVIVSHQLPIWVTRLDAEGRKLWHDPRKRECELASITSLTFEGTRLADVRYRDTSPDLRVAAS